MVGRGERDVNFVISRAYINPDHSEQTIATEYAHTRHICECKCVTSILRDGLYHRSG